MDFFDVVANRRSIRRFKKEGVPDSDIRKIIEAGIQAPSANNSQPWRFVVVKNRDILAKMADAVRSMVDRMIPLAESERDAQRLAAYKSNYYVFFEHAPVVIVVLAEQYNASTDRILRKMGYSDDDIKRLRPMPGLQSVSAAIENILLAAHALGYGACWMTGPLVAQDEFSKLLNYGKDMYAAALIPIGIPAEDPPARSRKLIDEVMTTIE